MRQSIGKWAARLLARENEPGSGVQLAHFVQTLKDAIGQGHAMREPGFHPLAVNRGARRRADSRVRIGSISTTPAAARSPTDGDTLRIGPERIRLHGIDAPESAQTCSAGGKTWACGEAATRALRERIGGRPVECTERDRDRYGRIVAVCSIAGADLNAWMVEKGWAVAYRKYSTDYVSHETSAKAARRGVWCKRRCKSRPR